MPHLDIKPHPDIKESGCIEDGAVAASSVRLSALTTTIGTLPPIAGFSTPIDGLGLDRNNFLKQHN